MTDNEQIMIDGVDVSGCADFITEMTVPDSYAFVKLKNRCFQECKYDQTAEQDVYLPCRDNPNCYYKQLQRKEKECEEVSNEIEELNVKYETVVNLAKKNADSNEYCLQELEKENQKLKQALDEIEELISDDKFIRCPINDDVNCNYFTRNKILDIITKQRTGSNDMGTLYIMVCTWY